MRLHIYFVSQTMVKFSCRKSATFTHFLMSNWFVSNELSEIKVLSDFQSSIILQEATIKSQLRDVIAILPEKSL